MDDPRSPEDWGDAYAELKPTYEAFAERLEELLRNLLQDDEHGYVESIWSTLKVDGLIDRVYELGRAGRHPEDPLEAFSDLAAVTFVTRTKAESEAICELVERELHVDTQRSVSLLEAQESNRVLAGGGHSGRVFYDSPRLVVSLTDARKELSEWRRFEGLLAEIRVETQLQRAWREIDEQVLPYVWDSSYPDAVQDIVVRALTHVVQADEALSGIADATDEIEVEYGHALTLDELESLDLSALYVYVRDADTVARLVAAAEGSGMQHYDAPPSVTESNLWLVRTCGFESMQELDAFVRGSESRATDIYGRLCELVRAEDDTVPWATPSSVLDWLLLVLTRAGADVVALTRYRPAIEIAVNTLIGNRVER